ncbi:hypothetical protein E8E12_002294 [Didymella heteroderae]|uniref:Uncharacterized protein n=1 Tax=Didymella heteroderae TaxID=1769908 RepID=A0A9P4WNR9_9PLEO|nr:hypothetical protein E8E12_002294 [Didymella heteroderae]
MVGINMVVYYMPTVLIQNVGQTPRLAQIIAGFVQLMFVIGTILPALRLDQMDCRKTLMTGCAGLSICMMLIAALLSQKTNKSASIGAVAFFYPETSPLRRSTVSSSSLAEYDSESAEEGQNTPPMIKMEMTHTEKA